MKQPLIYEYLVKYFELMGFTHKDLKQSGINLSFRFLKAVAVSYGQVENQYFLGEMVQFIQQNLSEFDFK